MDNSARSDVAAVARPSATTATTIQRVTGYPRVKHCLRSPAEEVLMLVFATKAGFAMVALAALLPAIYLLICFRKDRSNR